MAVLGPKIIIFVQKFLPCFTRHKLLTSNYLNFSRLTTLIIDLCMYVSMYQFILFSLAHISCTLYNIFLCIID